MLKDPVGDEQRMLDAWRLCAQRDLAHGRQVNIAATAKQVETPFGVACLVAYARSYVEAAQARQASLPPGGVA